MKSLLTTLLGLFLLLESSAPCHALISIGILNKKEAKDLGIVMKQRPNGDAGTQVWLEFKKEGFLKAFTYAELRMLDADAQHLVSARLQPVPAPGDASGKEWKVSFSAAPDQLAHCRFLVVAYGSELGDVGYFLNVKDFLDVSGPED